MNTLDKEKELIELLVKKIDENTSNKVKVICTDDYTEKRSDAMVAVGISNTTQMNVFLPDYEYTLNILVDVFIKDDKYGDLYEKTKNEVLTFLQPYIMDKTKLGELFQDIPVVGFFLDGVSNSTSDQSNKSFINLRVIVSY